MAMNEYDVDLEVKYFQIFTELVLKSENDKELKLNEIDLICDELYRQEFCKAFCVADMMDDKLDSSLEQYTLFLLRYVPIQHIIQSKQDLVYGENSYRLDENELQEAKQEQQEHNGDDNDGEGIAIPCIANKFVGITLYTYEMFHVTHRCIVSLLKYNTISLDLLEEFKAHVDKMWG